MKGLWIGNFCLSSSWLFLSPILARNLFCGIGFVFLGLMINMVGLKHTKLSGKFPYQFACPVLIICILTTPFPYNLSFIILLLGICFRFITPDRFASKAIENGLIFTGFILLLQTAALPFYLKMAPRIFNLNIFAYPAFLVLELFGIETSLDDHFLFVRDSTNVYNFSNDIEKFSIYLIMNIIVGSIPIILVFLKNNRLSVIFKIFVTAITYLVFRYASLIIIYLNYQSMVIFFNPWIISASFLPLILIYCNWFRWEKGFQPLESEDNLSPKVAKSYYSALVISAIGIFLIIGSWGFNDPGRLKKGTILIDEKHSDWEWTTMKFDRHAYGQKEAYNYYCLSYFLEKFYTVETNFYDLTAQTLKNTDVLIIKMPTDPFKSEEISAITDFVENGGGLFLIGDHTNVFGTSGYLNQLSDKFGLHFNFDATYDLITGNLTLYEAPKLLPHPVVRNLPAFLFGTSCTLTSPVSAEDIITGYQLRSVDLDYSQKHFFPEKIDLPNSRFGTFLQCSAIRYGKGRVLAFSDSTVFSNFWIFMPGKPELLLGSINWLNRKNIFPPHTNAIFLFLGISLVIISVSFICTKHPETKNIFAAFFSMLFAVSFSFSFYSSLNAHYYQLPQPHKQFQEVFFDLEHSNIALPLKSLVSHSRINYENFFVLPQRLGYIPAAKDKLTDCLKQNAILIIMNPDKNWTENSIRKIRSFVKEGGRLIVLDNRCNSNSTSNVLLEQFQMKMDFSDIEESNFIDFSERPIAATECAARIDGGKPMIFTLNNDAIVSVSDRGKGRVVAIGDSYLFSDTIMGNTMSMPNAHQKRIYELAYWIFEDLMINEKYQKMK